MELNSGEEFNASPFLRSSPDMSALLRETEPLFSSRTSEFGLGQAITYSEWLRASAAVESQRSGRDENEIIIDHLGIQGTDPRKIISYLLAPQATPLLAAATPNSLIQNLVSAADLYANQNPSNPNLIDSVQQIKGRMQNPPPAIPKAVFALPGSAVAPPTPTPYAPHTMPK